VRSGTIRGYVWRSIQKVLEALALVICVRLIKFLFLDIRKLNSKVLQRFCLACPKEVVTQRGDIGELSPALKVERFGGQFNASRYEEQPGWGEWRPALMFPISVEKVARIVLKGKRSDMSIESKRSDDVGIGHISGALSAAL